MPYNKQKIHNTQKMLPSNLQIWDKCASSHLKKIQIFQNKVLRIIIDNRHGSLEILT